MLPQIIIEGRAVADSELKFTQAGKALCKFRVAASDSRKDDAGNWETTEQIFVSVTLWDDAEKYAEVIQRGVQVTVAGRIHEREYEKSDGSKGRSLEIKYPMVKVIPQRGQGQQARPATQQAPANDPWATPPGAAAGDPWGQSGGSEQPPF